MTMKKKTVDVTEENIEGMSGGNITPDEKEVIAEEVSVANTEKVNAANTLIAQTFNIDDSYYVTGVADKGKSMTLNFANADYEVTVKIKDTERMGLLSAE